MFAHAALVTESILIGRVCPGCLAVAGVAALAALVQVWEKKEDRLTLASGLCFGALAALVHPFERVDDGLTRRFWPSRILDQAPAFVDRAQLASCEHARTVRLLVFEDERGCRSCSSVRRRILPALEAGFPTDLCIHTNVLPSPPPGQAFPLMILVSKKMHLVTLEGAPELREMENLVRVLVERAKSP